MMNQDRGSNPKLTLLPFLITAIALGPCPTGRCSTRPMTTMPASSPAAERSNMGVATQNSRTG